MKATELMIGDWVSYHGIVNKVAPADFDFHHKKWIDEIEPVPLTPEILEKNGFKLDKEDGWWWLTPKIGITFWEEGYIELDIENKHSSFNIHIKYLHQLQHALRLCGIEKEIDL